MSETITICENVCRDFFWTHLGDPRVVQGMLTVVAASIGAFVAIYIARNIYPIQKTIDRDERVKERHFDILVEMMDAIGRLASAHMNFTEMKEAQDFFARAKMKFSVIASDESMRKLGKFNRLVSKHENGTTEEINCAVAEFVREARKSNLGGTALSNSELLACTPFVPTENH